MVAHVRAEERGDERGALPAFPEEQRGGIRRALPGLTEERARSRPSASELSLGGLLKHVREDLVRAGGPGAGWLGRRP